MPRVSWSTQEGLHTSRSQAQVLWALLRAVTAALMFEQFKAASAAALPVDVNHLHGWLPNAGGKKGK